MSTPRSSSRTRPSSACMALASPPAAKPRSRFRADSGSARSGSTMPAASGSTPIASAASVRVASGAKACVTRWRSCRNGSSRACASIRNDRQMTSVGLIGCGGMAQDVLAALRGTGTADGVRIVGALARPGRGGEARAKLCGVDIVETLDELLARKPTLVAEVAGQAAVAEHADTVLLLRRLKSAAHEGNSRMLLPAGAVGGIDAIAAMRFAGLTSVRYRSRKPPLAWRGSPAERLVAHERNRLYARTAGGSAVLYPPNAHPAGPA